MGGVERRRLTSADIKTARFYADHLLTQAQALALRNTIMRGAVGDGAGGGAVLKELITIPGPAD